MANVLLIYPPQSFAGRKGSTERLAPPLGLLYLKSMISGHNVMVLDLSASTEPKTDFLRAYRSQDWDVVGVSVLTYCTGPAHQLAEFIRRNGSPYLVAGGPHATLAPESCLEMGFDAVVVGEAELVVGDVIENKPKGMIHGRGVEDLDAIPFPDRSVLDNTKYGYIFGFIRIPGIWASILTSRGCPFSCTFCGRMIKGKIRRRSIENIVAELKGLEEQGFEQVLFADDTFTMDKRWVLALCKALKKERMGLNFYCHTRVDSFDKEVARALRGIRTQYVSFGVESIQPEVLEFYNKTRNPSAWGRYTKKALKNCNDVGLYNNASLMIGAPMETEEMFYETYDFVDKCKVDVVSVNPLLYTVGSKIWEDAVENGIIREDEYMVSVLDRELCPIPPKRITEICLDVSDKVAGKAARRMIPKTLMHLDKYRFRVLMRGLKIFTKGTLKGYHWEKEMQAFKEAGYSKKGYVGDEESEELLEVIEST